MKLALSASLAVATALVASTAHADTPPTIWDLGKNPDAYTQYAHHVLIERDIDIVSELQEDTQEVGTLQSLMSLDHARTVVESIIEPKTPMLRFDEAWVLTKRGLWAQALPILEGLTHDVGTSTFSQEVWEKLAEAYVHVERTDDEIRAYDEVLARSMSDVDHVTPLLNQGEAYLRAGDANAAVAQFREVLHLTATIPNLNSVEMLAEWDIALALDRSGNPRAAREAARAATRLDQRCVAIVGHDVLFLPGPDPRVTFYKVPPGLYPIAEDNKSVYFVPSYERDWYLALGYEALAVEGGGSQATMPYWRDAEAHMMSYVVGATKATNDKWLDLGRQRLDELRKRRAAAEKKP